MIIMRERLWFFMINTKTGNEILSQLISKNYNLDLGFNIFTLVASFSAIAGWLVNEKLKLLWGAVQAIAAVMQVIKPLFPFSQHNQEIKERLRKSLITLHQLENYWFKYKYSTALSTEDEAKINSLMLKIIELHNVPEYVQVDSNDYFLMDVARERTESYIRFLNT
jgi:hypothetical protein